jgi:hypothetical protein
MANSGSLVRFEDENIFFALKNAPGSPGRQTK